MRAECKAGLDEYMKYCRSAQDSDTGAQLQQLQSQIGNLHEAIVESRELNGRLSSQLSVQVRIRSDQQSFVAVIRRYESPLAVASCYGTASAAVVSVLPITCSPISSSEMCYGSLRVHRVVHAHDMSTWLPVYCRHD